MLTGIVNDAVLIGIFALVVNNAFRIGRVEGLLKVHFDPPKKAKRK